jgi:tRNA wybutosine-synthesizing protein 3
LEHAQLVLSAALQAGFRESGAINLIPNTSKTTSSKDPLETQATPMVAVRSMGLGLESIIGYEDDGRQICIASESDLKTLIELSNERFKVNTQRIQRFRELLLRLCRDRAVGKKSRNGEWEDEAVRKERMRNEGLERREALRGAQGNTPEKPAKPLDLDDMAGLEFLE